MLVQTDHLEAQDLHLAEGEGDQEAKTDGQDEVGKEAVKMNGVHTQIRTILEEYLEAQGRNLIWDLAYKGKVYKDVEFVLFVPFVKGDTKEADENCCRFGTRNARVKQICRYCYCPTQESDNPLKTFQAKTQEDIQILVKSGKVEKLRQMSQHCVPNAWHEVQFGDPRGCMFLVHLKCSMRYFWASSST